METRIRRAGRDPTPEASQKAAMKLCDSNSETDLMFATLKRQFEEALGAL